MRRLLLATALFAFVAGASAQPLKAQTRCTKVLATDAQKDSPDFMVASRVHKMLSRLGETCQGGPAVLWQKGFEGYVITVNMSHAPDGTMYGGVQFFEVYDFGVVLRAGTTFSGQDSIQRLAERIVDTHQDKILESP